MKYSGLQMPGQAASEDELRVSLGLLNYTTGKGKVALSDTNMRPIEVFMCSVVRAGILFPAHLSWHPGPCRCSCDLARPIAHATACCAMPSMRVALLPRGS